MFVLYDIKSAFVVLKAGGECRKEWTKDWAQSGEEGGDFAG
jgi:hypothetical protein